VRCLAQHRHVSKTLSSRSTTHAPRWTTPGEWTHTQCNNWSRSTHIY
jgi:hypothetical protein